MFFTRKKKFVDDIEYNTNCFIYEILGINLKHYDMETHNIVHYKHKNYLIPILKGVLKNESIEVYINKNNSKQKLLFLNSFSFIKDIVGTVREFHILTEGQDVYFLIKFSCNRDINVRRTNNSQVSIVDKEFIHSFTEDSIFERLYLSI